MKQQRDSKGELRAAFLMRDIDNAKRICHTRPSGPFVRVALGIIFMYLVLISYMMLGAIGPVFISVLALVAFFVPHLYQVAKNRLQRRTRQKANSASTPTSTPTSTQEA